MHAINIYVRDQDESLRFYVDSLGFQVAFDAVLQSGERWVAVTPPDGGLFLSLSVPKADSRANQMIGRPTGIVFVTGDVVAKYSEWRKRGVQFSYTPRLRRFKYTPVVLDESADMQNRVWGGVFVHFRDPDGNSFALVGVDEVSQQIDAQRRAIAEKLEAERRAAQELEIAKQVQARLFPQIMPTVRTLEYAGNCIQARQVGGDYFDFFDLSGGRFGIVVGDIAGKGIAAALLMANLQANLRIQCAMLDQPRCLLRSVNEVFHRNSIESAYATLFFADYDDAEQRLRYVNCGHLPALVLRSNGMMERLEATATVLGLFAEWDCAVGERTLEPGDLLAIYTDGITECFRETGEDFGEERLGEALRRYRHLPAQEIVAAVVEEVRCFSPLEQQDDITLAIARAR